MWDIIVVGAGASGILSAIFSARQGARVLLLEQKDKIGKKIYATGNGKCNYTNANDSLANYYGDRDLLENVFTQFSVEDTISYFSSIGIFPKKKNGYYYPHSQTAVSVVLALDMELKKYKVPVRLEEAVTEIIPRKNTFLISTNKEQYSCKKVIVTTGLLASPKLGSDGNLLNQIKTLGHRFTPLVPALCGFYAKGLRFSKVAGVRTDAKLSLFVDDQFVVNNTGELQLTDYGISGIPTFQISHPASIALYQKRKVHVEIDFAPDIKENDLQKELHRRKEYQNGFPENILNGLFHQKLADQILEFAGFSSKTKILTLSEEQITQIVKAIKHCIISLHKAKGFEYAQVCAGGVKTEEINCKTLESKICKGLYFAGEILDVDGICGGYNLQWAWSSGVVAGRQATGAL